MLATVILAAGASRRMGAPKLLLPWGATTVIGQVVTTALAATDGPVVVVTGAHPIELPGDRRLASIWNEHWETGMLSSVQAGVQALPGGWESVLVMLGDLPAVTASTYKTLAAAPKDRICIPTYEGRRGHPIRIPAALAADLLALDPLSQSLRALLHPERVTLVPGTDPGIRMDLDTPYAYLREAYKSR